MLERLPHATTTKGHSPASPLQAPVGPLSGFRNIYLSCYYPPSAILSYPYFENPLVAIDETVENRSTVSLYLFILNRMMRLWFLCFQSSKPFRLVHQPPFRNYHREFVCGHSGPGSRILLPHCFKAHPHGFSKLPRRFSRR